MIASLYQRFFSVLQGRDISRTGYPRQYPNCAGIKKIHIWILNDT